MAQNRNYLVRMPTVAGTMPFLDIVITGPVGSPDAVVGIGQPTPAPVGWGIGGPFIAPSDGQYSELRGRPLRVPVLFGQPGFVPRLRLGWAPSVTPAVLGDGCVGVPSVKYSQSLLGALPQFPGVVVPDPSYGPSVRLVNNPDVQGGTFVVALNVFEAKDEDRDPTGV